MEYWIDGHFHRTWSEKVWYSHDRGVYVPKFATVRKEPNRIYITKSFALKILNPKRVFDMTDRNDSFDYCLSKIINVPWVKEPYVEPEPQFKVSLP